MRPHRHTETLCLSHCRPASGIILCERENGCHFVSYVPVWELSWYCSPPFGTFWGEEHAHTAPWQRRLVTSLVTHIFHCSFWCDEIRSHLSSAKLWCIRDYNVAVSLLHPHRSGPDWILLSIVVVFSSYRLVRFFFLNHNHLLPAIDFLAAAVV